MNEYRLINLHHEESTDKSFQLVSIIRKEHPNCAIYKKNIATPDENIIRTTLFTPKKRISKDTNADNHNVLSSYVSKEKHFGDSFILSKGYQSFSQ